MTVRTADAMRAYLRGEDPVLERRTLGTRDLDVAARRLEECCARTLAPVDECLFYRSNVGLAAGLAQDQWEQEFETGLAHMLDRVASFVADGPGL